MNKNIINIAVAIVNTFIFLPVFAQNDTKIILPSSPAFSILNFEPSSVMKPTSNKDFGADVLNSFDKNGKFLLNLGLDVSPYWLKSKPSLTREEYLAPTIGQCFIQSLNFSAATVKDSVMGSNKLGVGLRFKLLNGKPTDEYLEKEKELNVQLNISATIGIAIGNVGTTINSKAATIEFLSKTLFEMGYTKDVIASFKRMAEKKADEFDETTDGIKSFLKKINGSVIDSNATLIKKFAELSKKRVGFILEVAGASAFVTSKTSDAFRKTGVWINATNYFSSSDAWTVTGRYMFNNSDSGVTNADIGISYLKELSNINISVEGMARWYKVNIHDRNINNQPITRTEKSFTYRFSVQGSYNITADISFNMSLGKDFNSPFLSKSTLFSIFGFTYNLFRKTEVNLSKSKTSSN